MSDDPLSVLPAPPASAEAEGGGDPLRRWLQRLVERHLAVRRNRMHGIVSGEDWALRRREIRERLTEIAGDFPSRPPRTRRVPLSPAVTGRLEWDGGSVEKVVLQTRTHFYLTLNLYLPPMAADNAAATVIIQPDDSPEGKTAAAVRELATFLVSSGYAVVTYDPLGAGERVQYLDTALCPHPPAGPAQQRLDAARLCLVGGSLLSFDLWDGIRIIDYLTSRADMQGVPVTTVGTGLTGGLRAACLGGADERIRAAAVIGAATGVRGLLETKAELPPHLALPGFVSRGLDLPDLSALIAPRPILIAPPVMLPVDHQDVSRALRDLQQVYRLFGVADRVTVCHDTSSPEWRSLLRIWLDRWCGPVADGPQTSARETAAPPPEVADLRCTDSGQVVISLRSDTVNALTLHQARESRAATPIHLSERLAAEDLELIRERVRHCVGPAHTSRHANGISQGSVARDGYRFEKLQIEVEPELFVAAMITMPEPATAPRPVVVFVHPDGNRAIASPGGWLDRAAAAGWLGVGIELGRLTGLPDESTARSDTPFVELLLAGSSPAALGILGLHRIIDYLGGCVLADAGSCFVVGIGDAAPMVQHAALIDDRIRGLALVSAALSWQPLFDSAVAEIVPECIVAGAMQHYDLPDLLAAFAPRPLLIADPTDGAGRSLTADAVDESLQRVCDTYADLHAGDAVECVVNSDQDSGPAVSAWLQQQFPQRESTAPDAAGDG